MTAEGPTSQGGAYASEARNALLQQGAVCCELHPMCENNESACVAGVARYSPTAPSLPILRPTATPARRNAACDVTSSRGKTRRGQSAKRRRSLRRQQQAHSAATDRALRSTGSARAAACPPAVWCSASACFIARRGSRLVERALAVAGDGCSAPPDGSFATFVRREPAARRRCSRWLRCAGQSR